jgi:hypothetical protein
MSHPNHQRRRNRTFRVEGLESRELLSAVGVPAHHVAEVAPLVRKDPKIKGKTHGPVTNFGTGSGAINITATFSSGGKLEHLGKSTFDGTVTYSINGTGKEVTFSTGTANLQADNSTDVIRVSFDGIGKVTSKSKMESSFSWAGNVVGGTGIYANATGPFTAKGDLLGMKGEIKVTELKLIIP